MIFKITKIEFNNFVDSNTVYIWYYTKEIHDITFNGHWFGLPVEWIEEKASKLLILLKTSLCIAYFISLVLTFWFVGLYHLLILVSSCSRLTYKIYSGGGPSTYVFYMVWRERLCWSTLHKDNVLPDSPCSTRLITTLRSIHKKAHQITQWTITTGLHYSPEQRRSILILILVTHNQMLELATNMPDRGPISGDIPEPHAERHNSGEREMCLPRELQFTPRLGSSSR